ADVPAQLWTNWRLDPGFAPPDGESLKSLEARVRDACEDVAEAARDRDIVVVSHVSPIKAAVAWALGTDISISFRCHLEQCGVCRVAVGPTGPVLRSFNEVLYPRER